MNQLTRPKWIAAHVAVVVVAFVFINLGLWQLRRLDEVQLENAIAESRNDSPPQDLWVLLNSAGEDVESLEYRRVSIVGEFDPAHQILTRNQVYRDTAGFHVVSPVIGTDGRAVLVNRGWVPLDADAPDKVPTPTGNVTLQGWVRLSQLRPALGPVDPEGSIEVFSRVDIARIQEQTPYTLAPVYVVLDASAEQTDLPIALDRPEFNDEGPHLGYAIQWFGFTVIGLVGYGFLIKRALYPRRRRPA